MPSHVSGGSHAMPSWHAVRVVDIGPRQYDPSRRMLWEKRLNWLWADNRDPRRLVEGCVSESPTQPAYAAPQETLEPNADER